MESQPEQWEVRCALIWELNAATEGHFQLLRRYQHHQEALSHYPNSVIQQWVWELNYGDFDQCPPILTYLWHQFCAEFSHIQDQWNRNIRYPLAKWTSKLPSKCNDSWLQQQISMRDTPMVVSIDLVQNMLTWKSVQLMSTKPWTNLQIMKLSNIETRGCHYLSRVSLPALTELSLRAIGFVGETTLSKADWPSLKLLSVGFNRRETEALRFIVKLNSPISRFTTNVKGCQKTTARRVFLARWPIMSLIANSRSHKTTMSRVLEGYVEIKEQKQGKKRRRQS